MDTGFTPAIETDILNPSHIPAGDWKDDDWRAIDSLVESDAEPPAPSQLPITGEKQPTAAPVVYDRLLTENRSYSNAIGAVMLLPPDPNRKQLRILRVDTVATPETSPLFLASSKNALDGGPSQAGAALIPGWHLSDPLPLVLDGYTGPVWVSGDTTAAAYTFHISYVAVTR